MLATLYTYSTRYNSYPVAMYTIKSKVYKFHTLLGCVTKCITGVIDH